MQRVRAVAAFPFRILMQLMIFLTLVVYQIWWGLRPTGGDD